MSSKLFGICLFILGFHLTGNAQLINDDVLFTVNEDPVLASEFLQVYNKNLDLVKDESHKDIDTYLDLFIKYKLKIKEAKALGFDEKPKYLREFNNYKTQLAKNYLTDHKVTEAMVQEAYERVSYDVKVAHILMVIEPLNTDTTAIYEQMLAFKKRLKNEDFPELQKEINNGQTIIAEDLGYFSGFKMVYPFESAAYNTPVGEVSDPFRTQFGFHVLKVYDKRKSRGEVTVGHIMITNKQNDSLVNPEERIQEIYKLIQQGEAFESLAIQYSQDQSSAKKGGRLAPFKSGQLSAVEFEDVAFSLKEGEISKPFQTQYGWHIAKLYNKKSMSTFEDLKPSLEQRVIRDSRSKMITDAFVGKLMQMYNVNNAVDLSYFESIINEDYYNQTWSLPEDFPADKPFLLIDKKQLTYQDFGRYLVGSQKRVNAQQTPEGLVKTYFDTFVSQNVLSYHKENLENVNPEYAQVLAEYRDGLLLFDLMETMVWNAVKEDTVALKNYYEAHKSNYKWPNRVDAIVASSSDAKYAMAAKKGLENNISIDSLKASINTGEKQNVMFTSGLLEADHQALPESFQFKVGVSKIRNYNDGYHVIKVNEVVQERTKTFEEAKGNVISDYQQQFETQWLDDLHNKYTVKVDQSVLEKIKSEVNN